jgi:hypothetical protein
LYVVVFAEPTPSISDGGNKGGVNGWVETTLGQTVCGKKKEKKMHHCNKFPKNGLHSIIDNAS